jgi:Ribosomal protein S3, C-terminal domain
MGQKVNPISLRLEKTNKNYNSLWFGELAYGEFLKRDILCKKYIERVLAQIGETTGEMGVVFHPKKGKILPPSLWAEVSRNPRSRRFRLKGFEQLNVRNFSIPPSALLDMTHGRDGRWLRSASGGEDPGINKLRKIDNFRPYIRGGGSGLHIFDMLAKQIIKKGSVTRFKGLGRESNLLEDFSLLWKGFLLRLSLLSIQRGGSFREIFGTVSPLEPGSLESTTSHLPTDLPVEKDKDKFSKVTSFTKKAGCRDSFFLYSIGESVKEKNQSGTKERNVTVPFQGFADLPNPNAHRKGVVPLGGSLHGHVEKDLLKGYALRQRRESGVLLLSHIESLGENICKTPLNVYLWRSVWDGCSPIFLAKEIAYFLQRRVSFSKIRREILREISENKGRVWSSIEGIRVSCSGRSGGKSKKAQRSKSETFYWGRNSSSLFLSPVGFAKSTAFTQFGAIGVKVWICYK